jgi:hypothetical protein
MAFMHVPRIQQQEFVLACSCTPWKDICMDLVKATNAYSEAKAARQKASVLINREDHKERLESRLNELHQRLSRMALAFCPTNSSGSSDAATTTSSEPIHVAPDKLFFRLASRPC